MKLHDSAMETTPQGDRVSFRIVRSSVRVFDDAAFGSVSHRSLLHLNSREVAVGAASVQPVPWVTPFVILVHKENLEIILFLHFRVQIGLYEPRRGWPPCEKKKRCGIQSSK